MQLYPIASLLLLAGAASAQGPLTKQIAAPPADIHAGVIVLPEQDRVQSRSAWLPLEWRAEGDVYRARVPLAAERSGSLSLALLGSDVTRWQATIRGDGLPPTDLRALANLEVHSIASLDEWAPGWSSEVFVIDGVAAGALGIELLAPGDRLPSRGFVVYAGSAPLLLSSAVEGRRWTSDRDVLLTARLEGEPGAALVQVDEALVALETPFGPISVPLVDDGFGADASANDGTYSAWLPRGIEGELFARFVLRGRDTSAAPFVRTTQHVIPVLAPRARLARAPGTAVLDASDLAIDFELDVRQATKLQLSFEVWATRPGSAATPVVWLSRMAHADSGGSPVVRFVLDARWLNAAGAAESLELRNVRLQDPDTQVVLDAVDRLPLAVGALPALVGAAAGPITYDMLARPALDPVPIDRAGDRAGDRARAPGAATSRGLFGNTRPSGPRPEVRALMLVHGWCSGGNVWPQADFSQPKRTFVDPNANRSHDEFAQLVASFADSEGLDSFGLVGHSQGGAAALHLFTFYQSALDESFGGRRIQSVGTPYQGTPLATLGFFTCGTNNDLTVGGAAAWLSTIPTFARREVYYWTTSNSGSACDFFSNLILGSPNDGVIEMARGQLSGANSMGHETGWCHTTGMTDPAHYQDSVRNAEMDAMAAR